MVIRLNICKEKVNTLWSYFNQSLHVRFSSELEEKHLEKSTYGKAALCRWARMNQARERNSEDTQLGGLKKIQERFLPFLDVASSTDNPQYAAENHLHVSQILCQCQSWDHTTGLEGNKLQTSQIESGNQDWTIFRLSR